MQPSLHRTKSFDKFNVQCRSTWKKKIACVFDIVQCDDPLRTEAWFVVHWAGLCITYILMPVRPRFVCRRQKPYTENVLHIILHKHLGFIHNEPEAKPEFVTNRLKTALFKYKGGKHQNRKMKKIASAQCEQGFSLPWVKLKRIWNRPWPLPPPVVNSTYDSTE